MKLEEFLKNNDKTDPGVPLPKVRTSAILENPIFDYVPNLVFDGTDFDGDSLTAMTAPIGPSSLRSSGQLEVTQYARQDEVELLRQEVASLHERLNTLMTENAALRDRAEMMLQVIDNEFRIRRVSFDPIGNVGIGPPDYRVPIDHPSNQFF